MLDALLDSWDRNNIITVNLLRSVPPDAMDLTPADGSPSIAQLFMHMHYVRLDLRGRRRARIRARDAEGRMGGRARSRSAGADAERQREGRA